ncbi:MAG: hypothetical protein WA477_20865, partial [Candidatus Sulfotelmatobacter sp.]
MKPGKQLAATFLVIASLALFSSFSFAQEKASAKHDSEPKLALHEGWALQTSTKVEAKGEVISTPQFAP